MAYLMDVSLRDGGHRINFHFEPEVLEGILEPLDNAGLEFIEIGYRNGSIRPIPNIGSAGLCHQPYLDLCRSFIKKTNMAVMVHPGQVDASDLQELKAFGVNLIRICIPHGGVDAACPLIKLIHAAGLLVSVNFIHASQYQQNDLDTLVATVMRTDPDMVYFADSNGTLMPERVKRLYQTFTERYQTPFGFHAHNNLGMAQANTVAAIEAGAGYVDASLGGMGKGIGNLNLEFFVAYLHARSIKRYPLQPVLNAANYVRKTLGIGSELIDMDEFTRGIYDLSTAQVKQFISELN